MEKPNPFAAANAALFLVCALLGSAAHAQSRYFQGMSLGLGLTSSDTAVDNSLGSTSWHASHTDNNSILQLQYSIAAGDSFVVGLGGSANWNNLNAGQSGPYSYTLKDQYSLYVAPGYALDDTWLGYGKLAYLNANVQRSPGTTQNFDTGYGLGLGVQAMFTRNWFGQFEYMVNQYNDRTPSSGETLKLKSNIYSLTAGYRF